MPAQTPAQHDESAADGGIFAPDLHDTHHLWLKAVLLAVWVVASFGVTFYARELQALVEGRQLGYWMAAQGAVLIFIVLALVYCVAMDYFERQDQRHQAGSVPSEASSPAYRHGGADHGAGQGR